MHSKKGYKTIFILILMGQNVWQLYAIGARSEQFVYAKFREDIWPNKKGFPDKDLVLFSLFVLQLYAIVDRSKWEI